MDEAVDAWSFPNNALAEVSEPVIKTPSHPSTGAKKWRGLADGDFFGARQAGLCQRTCRGRPDPVARRGSDGGVVGSRRVV